MAIPYMAYHVIINAISISISQIHSKDDAAEEHNSVYRALAESPDNLCIYTDGSLLYRDGKRFAGAAAIFLRNDIILHQLTLKQGLGASAEVYDAEMRALGLAAAVAVAYAITNNVRSLHFFSDCNAAVQSITQGQPRAAQMLSLLFQRSILWYLQND